METNNADHWLSEIDLSAVLAMLVDNGAEEIIYKILPQNANSKNQVYLASDFSQLGKIPTGEVTSRLSISEKSGKQEAVFSAPVELYWLDENGIPHPAPQAQLIFYPQYPEVRLSGFLKGCRKAPSSLMSIEKRGKTPDRVLIFGISSDHKVFALTLPPESPAAKEIRRTEPHTPYGVLNILPLPGNEEGDGYLELMQELCLIHHRQWVPSTRLAPDGEIIRCNASNCNGNTLESLLGIRSNGYSLPDFRGWEVKARQVPDVDRPGASTVTLFTPEPTEGIYTQHGVAEFVRRYGYPDTKGRDDRLNFGGIYRVGAPPHHATGLRLFLDGFDSHTGKYRPDGAIQLLDQNGTLAASWPFAKLMDHWKVKHAHAAFVPSQFRRNPDLQYRFGRKILLGEGADFRLFLKAVHEGHVYYDPGIKLEAASSSRSKTKQRSQFRVASKNLVALYESSRIVDTCEQAGILSF